MHLIFNQNSLNQFDSHPDSFVVFEYSLNNWENIKSETPSAFTKAEMVPIEKIKDENQQRLSLMWRLILKSFFSQLLDLPKIEINFSTSKSGKPYFCETSGLAQFEFSASHTPSHGAIAISKFGPIGLDIESADRKVEWQPIASRFFSKKDQENLANTSPEIAKQEFLKIWTRIESIIKMQGDKVAHIFDSSHQEHLTQHYPKARPLIFNSNLIGHLACANFPRHTPDPIPVLPCP